MGSLFFRLREFVVREDLEDEGGRCLRDARSLGINEAGAVERALGDLDVLQGGDSLSGGAEQVVDLLKIHRLQLGSPEDFLNARLWPAFFV